VIWSSSLALPTIAQIAVDSPPPIPFDLALIAPKICFLEQGDRIGCDVFP